MLQMVQEEQRTAYLAGQTVLVNVVIITDADVRVVAKMKLANMTGGVAAPDASPPAAILAFPRAKDVVRVFGDPLLEGEQGCSFMGDAASSVGVLGF